MAISILDLFTIGIGPSSSHTVGPMRAARTFATGLDEDALLGQVTRVRAELFGSLGATGRGHGTDRAVILGLAGHTPETVDTTKIPDWVAAVQASETIDLLGKHAARLAREDLVLHRRESLPRHPNGMRFQAFDSAGLVLRERVYYSVGGGFVLDENAAAVERPVEAAEAAVALPFHTGAELLDRCHESGLAISAVVLTNEMTWRSEAEIRHRLLQIWSVMQECVRNGCTIGGTLPGGLNVPRRAPALHRQLRDERPSADPLRVMDWVTLFALAVNEENAAGGRVVTAPTNGAAGILPAVLHYYTRFIPGADSDGVTRFLLTAGAIGLLFKENASISGAEVGCQGEVGAACSMAAAGLCEVLGGSPEQVENAAEIGMEHNLGLTCDPVAGLVQIPCIERNAMGAMNAVNASRIALRGDGSHIVSLDEVIKTMRETGADMKSEYKETSRGGLAVNVIEC
jgi:L-serine dehydratase